MTNEGKITFYTCVGHFFTHFYELLFPALAIPLTISLKLDLADVLKLSFLMYLLYGLTALPWGIFADRLGNRISLVIFFFGTGLGSAMTAFSKTPLQITLSLAVIGFFASIYHPAGMGLITRGIKKRGHALGINGVAGNVGMISAPFAAGLLNWLVGWQITYLIIGSLSILFGIGTAAAAIDETPVSINGNNSSSHSDHNRYGTYFLVLCIIMTVAGLAYRANSITLPSYLEYRAGFLLEFFKKFEITNLQGAKTFAATLLASSVYLISTVGQLIGGKLADRYDLRRMYLLFHGLSLPFVVMMAFVSQQYLVTAAALYVFFALGMQPIENSLVAKFTPDKWRSTAYGIKFILVFGVGSFTVYIVAWLKETWSLNSVYLFVSTLVAILVLLIVFLMWISRGIPCKNIEEE